MHIAFFYPLSSNAVTIFLLTECISLGGHFREVCIQKTRKRMDGRINIGFYMWRIEGVHTRNETFPIYHSLGAHARMHFRRSSSVHERSGVGRSNA